MKNIRKTLRLNEKQWEEVKAKMNSRGMNFSNFALFCMTKQCKINANPIKRELLTELARWGNNLNQATKHINTQKGLDRVGLEMLSKIEEHLKAIRAKNDC